jgi:hypothetical protein
MHWIDIILPEPETHQELDTLLNQAAEKTRALEQIQQRDGLDNVSVVKQMAQVGGLLFQAVQAFDPAAFDPDPAKAAWQVPDLGDPEHDRLVGFHLVVGGAWPFLPWTWLHNGLGFLLEKHPIVTSESGSSLPSGTDGRPWMQRCRRAEFLVDDQGASSLAGTLDQLRPEDLTAPEFLFVPGHTDDKVRRMIYREAEAIEGALAATDLGEPLARLRVPQNPVTPVQLKELSLAFQAMHFAGSVSQPASGAENGRNSWLDSMIDDLNAPSETDLEAAMGIEGEVLGVDPITSLLDDVSQRYEQEQLAGGHGYEKNSIEQGAQGMARFSGGSGGDTAQGSSPWLLEDGPVEPESLGKAGGIPPLVYSNSYCALPELGRRFIAAGASTFIGPVAPLFSRPARIFSGYCYQALGEGWCAGAAVWQAALQCRRELSADHPAWLSYGVHGYGSLSLQYL